MADSSRAATDAGRLVWPILFIVSLASAAPLWTSPHLPPQDLPSHLSILATLARDGEPGWSEHFEDRRSLQPYTALYSAAVVVVRAFGAETTGRILLTLYVVLLPLSVASVLRVLRPGAELAGLLAVPLTYSDVYLMGFLNFLLSLPLLFFAVALGLATLRGGPRVALPASALCGCLLLACYAHPVSLALFLLFTASWLVFCASGLRSLMVFGAACLPAAGVFLAWFLANTFETSWRVPELYKLSYLLLAPAFPLDAGGVPEANGVMAGVVALVISVAASAFRARSGGRLFARGARAKSARDLFARIATPWAAFVAVLGLYFAMPFARDYVVWVDLRFATVVWILLILCVAGTLVASRFRIAVGAATVLVYLIGVVRVHQAYSREAAPLFKLLDELPDDARLLPILLDARSDAINPSHLRERVVRYSSPYTHFASWYHLEKRGESPYMAFHPSMEMLPVALANPFYRHQFGVGGAFAPERAISRLPTLAPKFDFILVRVRSLQGLAAIEEVATLYASEPPFHAFAVDR